MMRGGLEPRRPQVDRSLEVQEDLVRRPHSLTPARDHIQALIAGVLIMSLTAGRAGGQGVATDWTAVDQALGRNGAMQPGDVMRYSFPRSDLQVTVAGVTVKPALALGSWVAF